MHRPLRITWSLASPVVKTNDDLLHLDALVAYSVCEEARELGASNAVELSKDLNHVFQLNSSPMGSVWSASAVIFTPASEPFATTMVRRSDAMEYMLAQDAELIHGRKRSMLQSAKGPDRAYFIYQPYQWMEKATAWCIADEQELRSALTRIPALGKMTRNGFGRIIDVSIQEDEEALEKWKLRYLPPDMDGAKDTSYATVRPNCLQPPYWDKLQYKPSKEPLL